MGRAAYCSGWVHEVCTGHIHVYKIHKHTHPDSANYVFARDRYLTSLQCHMIQQEWSQAHWVLWLLICYTFECGQLSQRSLPVGLRWTLPLKIKRAVSKNMQRRETLNTNVTPSVSSHCVRALIVLGNLSFPFLFPSFGSGSGRTRIVYSVHHALRWHYDVVSYLFFSHVLHFELVLTAVEHQSDVFTGLPMIDIRYLHFQVLIVNEEPVVVCIK